MIQHERVVSRRPESPCIKVCQLEGDTCLGCHRSLDEIGRWSRMDAAEREVVWERLDALTKWADEQQSLPQQD
ncbi:MULTISPECIES: DUF1289 domain-containing protein [Halomonas]|uniref:DUF1289 domain-containing protein n=1 Tax=Halomonas tibetensis TaxID=2259590 RepID=A0ABV7B5Q2_9GAMM